MNILYRAFRGWPLQEAIDANETPSNTKKVIRLAHEPHLNEYYVGLTPLQRSLLWEKFSYVVILLKHSADPNLECNGSWNGKPIQRYIIRKDISVVRLLALYGANTEGIIFPPNSKAIFQAYQEAYQLYEQKQTLAALKRQLQDNPADAALKQQIKTLSKELSNQFATLAKKEIQPPFQAHYREESLRYHHYVENECQTPHHSSANLIAKLARQLGFFRHGATVSETTPLLHVSIGNSNQGNGM